MNGARHSCISTSFPVPIHEPFGASKIFQNHIYCKAGVIKFPDFVRIKQVSNVWQCWLITLGTVVSFIC